MLRLCGATLFGAVLITVAQAQVTPANVPSAGRESTPMPSKPGNTNPPALDHPCSLTHLLSSNFRPLLVFSPSASSPYFLAQQKILNAPGASAILADYQVSTRPICPEETARLRRHFHVAPAEFTVILLGKDGGEKLRSHTPVKIETLTSLIDTMPMRQQEILNRTRK